MTENANSATVVSDLTIVDKNEIRDKNTETYFHSVNQSSSYISTKLYQGTTKKIAGDEDLYSFTVKYI